MKKIRLIAAAMVVAMMVSACGGSTTSSTSTPVSESTPVSAVEGLKEAIAEQPALLTSVGQSADVEMVKTMLTRSEINFVMDNLATADSIGDAKTLVLAIGGSSKGLGAAGIDADQELVRVGALIDAAKEKGLVVIALHIGGEARRGDLSDKFIAPSFEKADYAIIVEGGDKDGLMNGLASDANIPMDVVASIGEVTAPLKAAFK